MWFVLWSPAVFFPLHPPGARPTCRKKALEAVCAGAWVICFESPKSISSPIHVKYVKNQM